MQKLHSQNFSRKSSSLHKTSADNEKTNHLKLSQALLNYSLTCSSKLDTILAVNRQKRANLKEELKESMLLSKEKLSQLSDDFFEKNANAGEFEIQANDHCLALNNDLFKRNINFFSADDELFKNKEAAAESDKKPKLDDTDPNLQSFEVFYSKKDNQEPEKVANTQPQLEGLDFTKTQGSSDII